MNTKLTLSLEKEVIEKAKIYAKGTGRSLSEMVENYFRNLVSRSQNDTKIEDEYGDIDPKLKKLIGIIKLPEDFDMEKVKEEYHKEKYGI
jgi:hypothetical protein